MKGQLIDHVALKDGTQRITLSINEDFSHAYDELKDGPVNVEIKKYRKRRSLDANAYAWELIGKLAGAMELSPAEVYRELIRDIGDVSEVVCVKNEAVQRLRSGWTHNGLGWFSETFPSRIYGCTNVVLYYGSSTYDTKQMSALIDAAIEACKIYGIPYKTPEELASLKGLAEYAPKAKKEESE